MAGASSSGWIANHVIIWNIKNQSWIVITVCSFDKYSYSLVLWPGLDSSLPTPSQLWCETALASYVVNTMQIKGHLCFVCKNYPQLSSLYFFFCFQWHYPPCSPNRCQAVPKLYSEANYFQVNPQPSPGLPEYRSRWQSLDLANTANTLLGDCCYWRWQAWPRYRNMKFPDQSRRPNGFIISLINTTTHPVLAPPTICQVIQIFRNQNMTRFLQE